MVTVQKQNKKQSNTNVQYSIIFRKQYFSRNKAFFETNIIIAQRNTNKQYIQQNTHHNFIMGKQGCSICRCLSMSLTLAIIVVGGYAAWFFFGQPSPDELLDAAKEIGTKIKDIDFGDFTNVLENFTGFSPDLFNEDPYVGDNTTNLWLGHTKGEGGLYLTLWNALDESWQQEYSEAVNDWNTRCDPKVLVLTSKDVAVDNECTQADGVMKVCNGTFTLRLCVLFICYNDFCDLFLGVSFMFSVTSFHCLEPITSLTHTH